ncbi:Exonuclease SbcC [Vibrio crassostreae]|uniref:hypothetical protein n=1 Tax=Vibrio crassostreae TaxID=246167 RepID=UPI00148C827F|nr:hypothetical protein [Vibrio crassostreae]NOH74409.1 hypothetical protein [Vibrio crassostreae]CAK2471179.1 Exonuclease SbcC [Vibrio crassostreae]CAK2852594.1 Exonuclease SbcC [Vibrio crassostreae]CAK3449309.1 Exonuclease SbcC [Vibrio crassostreae]
MAEYDKKNRELFEENSKKIQNALDIIRKNNNLKATVSEVAAITGLHRNTLSKSSSRGENLSKALEQIKKDRKQLSERCKVTRKQHEENLQNLLDQSKLEILHWFTKYSESDRELEKLRNRLKQESDSLEWYRKELKKAQDERSRLDEKVKLLESMLGNGA